MNKNYLIYDDLKNINNINNLFCCNVSFKINSNGLIEQKRFNSYARKIRNINVSKIDKNKNNSKLNALYDAYLNTSFKNYFSFDAFISLPEVKKYIDEKKEINKIDLKAINLFAQNINKEIIITKNNNEKKCDKYYHKKKKDNLRRTVNLIYDVCNNNEFKSFITLTLNPDCRYIRENNINIRDNKQCYYFVQNWLKQCRKVDKNFKYIGVYEKMKNGNIHYHFLTNWECGSKYIPHHTLKRNRRKSKSGYQIIEYPEIYGWNYGFGNEKETPEEFQIVGEFLEDCNYELKRCKKNLGFCQAEKYDAELNKYITKSLCEYLTKSTNENPGRKIYKSNNCERSITIYGYVEETSREKSIKVVDDKTGEVCEMGIVPQNAKISIYHNKYNKTAIFKATYKVKNLEQYSKIIEYYLFHYLNKDNYVNKIKKQLNNKIQKFLN